MSTYDTLMLGMEAANTANLRRTTALLDDLASRHATAEARQAQIEALRNTVFSAAKIVVQAEQLLPGSPPASYYLAMRAAPVLGPRGVPDSVFPDFTDKTFHSQAAARFASVMHDAQRQLAPDAQTRIERLVWLEAAIPLLKSHVMWAQIARLVRSGKSLTPKPAFSFGRVFVALMIVGLLMARMWGHFLLAWAIGAGVLLLWAKWSNGRTRAAVSQAQEIAARGGDTFPVGTTDAQVQARAQELTNDLAHLDLHFDPTQEDRERATLAQYETERALIWNDLFAGPAVDARGVKELTS